MHDVKDRLEKLLRLATNNPNEEEARSAALKFCKTLVEHKGRFELGPAAPPVTPRQPHTPHHDWYGPPPPQRPYTPPTQPPPNEQYRPSDGFRAYWETIMEEMHRDIFNNIAREQAQRFRDEEKRRQEQRAEEKIRQEADKRERDFQESQYNPFKGKAGGRYSQRWWEPPSKT